GALHWLFLHRAPPAGRVPSRMARDRCSVTRLTLGGGRTPGPVVLRPRLATGLPFRRRERYRDRTASRRSIRRDVFRSLPRRHRATWRPMTKGLRIWLGGDAGVILVW